jgi:hypothetical protein
MVLFVAIRTYIYSRDILECSYQRKDTFSLQVCISVLYLNGVKLAVTPRAGIPAHAVTDV